MWQTSKIVSKKNFRFALNLTPENFVSFLMEFTLFVRTFFVSLIALQTSKIKLLTLSYSAFWLYQKNNYQFLTSKNHPFYFVSKLLLNLFRNDKMNLYFSSNFSILPHILLFLKLRWSTQSNFFVLIKIFRFELKVRVCRDCYEHEKPLQIVVSWFFQCFFF